MSRQKRQAPSLVHVLIVSVLLLWATTIVFGFIVPSYQPPESLTLVTMAVIGPLIGTLIVKKKEDDTPDDSTGGGER